MIASKNVDKEPDKEPWDDISDLLDEKTQPSRPALPSWARRFPKRTIVLASVAGVSFILYWIFQSTVATAPQTSDANAFLAPWRYALAAQALQWVWIVGGASALWTWLLHVRDRENLARTLAYNARIAKGK